MKVHRGRDKLRFRVAMPGMEALVISIVLGGIVAMVVLDRSVPSKWVPPTRSYEELKAEVGSLISFSQGALLAVLALVALGSTLGFGALASLVGHPAPDAAFVLRPEGAMFLLPGLFLGAATAALLEPRLDRWIAKERYCDVWFVDYRNRHPRSPPPDARTYLAGRRATTFLLPTLATVSLVASCLMLDTYAYVTPTEIVVNPFWGFEQRHHPFADVRSINTRYIGKGHNELECRIGFKDSSTFSTDPMRLTNRQVEALATYVFDRTAVPWTHDPHP